MKCRTTKLLSAVISASGHGFWLAGYLAVQDHLSRVRGGRIIDTPYAKAAASIWRHRHPSRGDFEVLSAGEIILAAGTFGIFLTGDPVTTAICDNDRVVHVARFWSAKQSENFELERGMRLGG